MCVLCVFFHRFRAGLIYTYIGEVCVSVNPYRTLNIYGQDYVNKYKGELFAQHSGLKKWLNCNTILSTRETTLPPHSVFEAKVFLENYLFNF